MLSRRLCCVPKLNSFNFTSFGKARSSPAFFQRPIIPNYGLLCVRFASKKSSGDKHGKKDKNATTASSGALAPFDFDAVKERMGIELTRLKTDFQALRAGRVTPQLLHNIKVKAYDQDQALQGLATISVRGPFELFVSVHDASLTGAVTNALQKSDEEHGNMNVANVQNGILIKFAKPTAESRAQLVKLAKTNAEDCKVVVRRIRQKAIDNVRSREGISKDEKFRDEGKIDQITKTTTESVDKLFIEKQKDIEKI